MVEIEKLKAGDVVRLVSGSPYMTVRGFRPPGGPPGHRQPPRTHVCVVVWSNRLGFLEKDFPPEILIIPPPRPVGSERPEDDEAGE